MTRRFGRSLQLLGLIVLPLAVAMQLVGGTGRSSGLSDMLLLAIAGTSAFFIGRLIEGYARP